MVLVVAVLAYGLGALSNALVSNRGLTPKSALPSSTHSTGSSTSTTDSGASNAANSEIERFEPIDLTKAYKENVFEADTRVSAER